MRRLLLPLFALLAAPAAAEPWRAEYALTLAGVRVMEAQITFDILGPRYRVETRIRSRGLATMISRGDQVTRSEGAWRGNDPVPLRCEGSARMFDARRLSVLVARTHGQAEDGLHCSVESRQLGGIPTDRDPDAASQPQTVEAWFARPEEGGPAVPLRVQLASRWWGRMEARLIRLERAPG
jgi:hypothetical protein